MRPAMSRRRGDGHRTASQSPKRRRPRWLDMDLGEVRTGYDEYGEGKPLVLLRSGGADARAWAPSIEAQPSAFECSRQSGAAAGEHRLSKARSRMS
jgi:hypothetical protein